MFCTSCGKELEDDMVFCTSCGAPVAASASNAQPIPIVVEDTAPEGSQAQAGASTQTEAPSQPHIQAQAENGPEKLVAERVTVEQSAPRPVVEKTTLLESVSADVVAPDPPITVLTRNSTGAIYRIDSYPTTLGKGSAADVIIDGNPSISRVHACLNSVGAVVTIEDRGSTNGVFYNGRRLETGHHPQLATGGVIELGGEGFTVAFE